MAAYGCSTCCRDLNFDGIHLLRIRNGKTVAAPRCDRDVQFDYYLRVNPRRAECDSSRDHVARDCQCDSVRLRRRLVFLRQSKRRRLFSRTV